jgi:hypothetical protein
MAVIPWDEGPASRDSAVSPVALTAAVPSQQSASSTRAEADASRIRGPFEPANAAAPAGAEGPAGPAMSQAARASMWSPSTAKMDQIKDLYLTAEAIGEDALDKHFQQVSERQRQLIREYFDQVLGGQAEGTDRG